MFSEALNLTYRRFKPTSWYRELPPHIKRNVIVYLLEILVTTPLFIAFLVCGWNILLEKDYTRKIYDISMVTFYSR